MVSVHTITLGFVPGRIWSQAIARYHATRNPDLVYKHWFVHQHYPLEKAANAVENAQICRDFGVEWIDPGRNLGLHGGFNWALAQIKPNDEDIIIAYDPDMYPLSPGWDMALVRAIRGDPEQRIVWASLMHTQVKAPGVLPVLSTRKADGFIELLIMRHAIMNSTCAWRASWLKRVGGLSEPRAFYGHLEAAMWAKLGPREQWAFVRDWEDSDRLRLQHDRAYTEYKWIHAHHMTWDGDFESWLAAGSPNPNR